jgi:hypothetical protein
MVYVSIKLPGQERGRTVFRAQTLDEARALVDSYDFSTYPDGTLVRLSYKSGLSYAVPGWGGSILYEQYEVQGGLLVPSEGLYKPRKRRGSRPVTLFLNLMRESKEEE